MKKQITIKTAIHSGIYASQGGGHTREEYSWNLGPINLLKAVKKIDEHNAAMDASYGSIGHAGSWIEIDGERISSWDYPENMDEARDLVGEYK